MTAGPPGGRELTGVKMAGAGRTHDAWMSLAPAAEPALREQFPALPDDVLWKTELLFRGVRFTPALAEAAEEGAAPNFWPYRRRDAHGHLESIAVPYLFHLAGGGVARVRVEDGSPYEVRRDRAGYHLWSAGAPLCDVEFVRRHAWQDFRTPDGLSPIEAGVEQLGDMVVVNVSPGCEYFRATSASGASLRCSYCGYGRFDARSKRLGQHAGQVELPPETIARLTDVLKVVCDETEVHHAYLTGGSLLDPLDEARRYAPIVETVRRAVGDRMRVTIGSGALDADGSRRMRDAGADSCCYNLEVWDASTFAAACPGKAQYVGRERWLRALTDAVGVFGQGNVATAMVAGLELRAPGPQLTPDAMVASIVEGATWFLDRGIMPVYSPLWPVPGTQYGPQDGISPAQYLEVELAVYRLREARRFPVPHWLMCPGCAYMLLEVDFDRAFGLTAPEAARSA